jgi:hypothetical protein
MQRAAFGKKIQKKCQNIWLYEKIVVPLQRETKTR